MWHLRGMFVAGTYMAITCEVDIAVACVVAHICKNVGSVCVFSIIAVKIIFRMWQPYLLVTYHICLQ